VCPTEAIIPGDFHDPESRVWRLKREHELSARKVEAGTGPNVLYLEVSAAGIDPLKTSDVGGHLWAARHPAIPMEGREFDALQAEMEEKARARTTYDVAHPPLWGWKISAYLLTKALAAGVFLASIASGIWQPQSAPHQRVLALGVPALGLLFLALTSVLLVADLKRPERFYLILTHPNSRSWLVRGHVRDHGVRRAARVGRAPLELARGRALHARLPGADQLRGRAHGGARAGSSARRRAGSSDAAGR
jgi:hypothetical protein